MIYLHPKEIRRFLILIEIAKDGVGFLFSPRPDGQLRKPKLTRRENAWSGHLAITLSTLMNKSNI